VIPAVILVPVDPGWAWGVVRVGRARAIVHLVGVGVGWCPDGLRKFGR